MNDVAATGRNSSASGRNIQAARVRVETINVQRSKLPKGTGFRPGLARRTQLVVKLGTIRPLMIMVRIIAAATARWTPNTE